MIQKLGNVPIHTEQGSVILEASLACSFLLMIVAGLFDIGGMIHAHIALTHAAHEAGRLGSRIESLASDSNGYGHNYINARAQGVLSANNWLRVSNVQISSTCKPVLLKGGINSDTVEVRVHADFDAMFPFFDQMPLHVNHTTNYFGRGSCV